MLPRIRFGGIAERRENGSAFVPVGKLIGIVAAAELSGLSRGKQQDGLIPVSGIGDKPHRRAVALHGSAYTVIGSRQRLVGDAKKAFQWAFMPDGVKHLE